MKRAISVIICGLFLILWGNSFGEGLSSGTVKNVLLLHGLYWGISVSKVKEAESDIAYEEGSMGSYYGLAYSLKEILYKKSSVNSSFQNILTGLYEQSDSHSGVWRFLFNDDTKFRKDILFERSVEHSASFDELK